MSSSDDLTERLRRLGLRVGRDALAAFLAHVHKSRLGPTETVEQLVDLEERARVAVNLQRRTRFACLGSGLGKTMIAQNLAQAALTAGFTVRFSTLAAALADLLGQESMPAFERRLRRYTSPDLLVLDELGYLPCDSRAADILYNIISRRHEQRSTVITTNLPFKQWGTTFPGAACVVALVDRFAQHCHRVDILGESWRNKHQLEPDRPPAKTSRSRRLRT